MFERFDQPATKVIRAAFAEAANLGDDAVCTEHLLLALATATTVTARLLEGAGARCGRHPPRPRRHPLAAQHAP